MNGIIIPSEAALLGILTISLLYAAIRLLRRRVDVMSVHLFTHSRISPFWFGRPCLLATFPCLVLWHAG